MRASVPAFITKHAPCRYGAFEAYAIDIVEGVGRVRLPAGVTALVAYRAGLAARWNALPAGLAHGVTLLAVHWWENRQADAALPTAVAALWRPFRRLGIGR
ncbi:hypothetical protein GCM10011380_19830 [Sphingomonas metalli]|uniref:Uncharacterized protein n=1 Tax=Sphingomonas metalli TaxID=1779358 RepID=A0A916T3H6_9SPHN|nr:hypothetical protein [Sphingomonas metalli]GGB30378.1 hypothetical protein GCM10011380_19830 [Sphingomonas metalli]